MTTIPDEVDVIVSGYGPVGAALACLLGGYGVRTLVVDKEADIFLAPRAIALDNEALRILQLVGLGDGDFDQVAIPYVRMRCPYVGEFLKIDTSGEIDGHPKLVTFHQPSLERALRALSATHDTVTAATSVELKRFVDSGANGGVRVWLNGADGTEHMVRAKFLVGADGASSTVRAAIGQQFVGETYSEDWLIVDALGVPDNIDHVEFICDPRRPTPHMVAPGGRTRWEFMLHPGEAREDMEKDEAILSLLAPWADARELTIERRAVYRFHARSCERFSRGRVFLVGDAAHVTPPFAGQGLVAGLRDAANLAWKLAWVLRWRVCPSVLDTYDEERRPHAVKMIALAKLMGQLIMPRGATTAALIHGALKVARRVPGMRPYVEGLEVKPKQHFASGLFVKGRGGLRRGSVIPQFLVRTPQGEIVRSDEVLGSSLALVGFGADASVHLDTAARGRWAAMGGTTASIILESQPAPRASDAYVAFEAPMSPRLMRRGWCAIVRPDRTIMHDGPAAAATRIANEAIALLAGDDAVRGQHGARDLPLSIWEPADEEP